MGLKGFVKKMGSTIIEYVGKIYPTTYEKYAPRLTCAICGKQFLYRGIEDSASVAGKIYDPDTDEYIDVPGTEEAICDECRRKMSGGPLDGKTAGDLKNEDV